MKKIKDEVPKIRKGYKYSLRVTSHQAKILHTFMKGSNLVYNLALMEQRRTWRTYKAYVDLHGERKAKEDNIKKMHSEFGLVRFYQEWRKSEKWGSLLSACPTTMLAQSIIDCNRAMVNFFRKNALPPAFKRDLNYSSFRFVQIAKMVDQDVDPLHFNADKHQLRGTVRLPLVGVLSYYKSRDFIGMPKNYTISCEAGKFFISIQTELEVEINPVAPKNEVAIDFGLEPFLSLSDGTIYETQDFYSPNIKRINLLMSRLQGSEFGSKNYNKKKLILEKLHNSIKDKRSNYLHKLTTELANKFDAIYIPDIKITTWDQSKRLNKRRGIDEQPSPLYSREEYTYIRQQLRDRSWNQFIRFLQYKLADRGKNLIKVESPSKAEGDAFPYFKSSIENANSILAMGKINSLHNVNK